MRHDAVSGDALRDPLRPSPLWPSSCGPTCWPSRLSRGASRSAAGSNGAHGRSRPDAVEQPETVPTRYGPIKARLYRPVARPTRAALLVGGVQPAGIDEPRLAHFAREVAASGWAIVTPELPDLVTYRLTPRSTDMIEDAAVWLSAQRDLTIDGQIGLVGISFAGGLSIVAAGTPIAARPYAVRVFVWRTRQSSTCVALPVHRRRT